MRHNFVKQPGGVLVPANDQEVERMSRYQNGSTLELEIKKPRNPAFHGKMFAFLTFCFENWAGGVEFHDEAVQFDAFRKQLTILAGYGIPIVNLRNHKVSYEAQSLSYANMDQEEFEKCYSAMINAALKNIFYTTTDEMIINRLYSFF